MKYPMNIRSTLQFSIVFFLVQLLSCQILLASEGTTNLAEKVAALKLGIYNYTIGTQLSEEKKIFAAEHMLSGAYEGTYKFSDGDLHVVVAKQDDTVLALYQRNEDAEFEQAKKMVSGLMGLFGNPTAMAHDKLIYWAYNDAGKIQEEEYNTMREATKKLDVLATVKFSSAFEITGEDKDNTPKGAIYFIISSDRLTAEFMQHL